jgi:hypothetical protein
MSEQRAKKKQQTGPQDTGWVQRSPSRQQAHLLHCQAYIATIAVLAQAHDAGMIADGFSAKDVAAALSGAIKNQARRNAKSVPRRLLEGSASRCSSNPSVGEITRTGMWKEAC